MRQLRSLLIKRSSRRRERSIFSSSYYLNTYLDVAQARVDPFNHFMVSGWMEGRNPRSDFSTLYYRDKHLAGQHTNPLTHYVDIGMDARLSTQPHDEAEFLQLQAALTRVRFSESTYLAQAGNVVGDPLLHYLKEGWRHGYMPASDFDGATYLQEHRHIEQLRVSPLYHAMSQDRLLRRPRSFPTQHFVQPLEIVKKTSADALSSKAAIEVIKTAIKKDFDADYYLLENGDVREANKDPLAHYVEYGWREHRKPHRLFDPGYYLRQNPDVAAAGAEPFFHYLRIGRKGGRRGNPTGDRLYPSMQAPKAEEWQNAKAAADLVNAECVVVVPVYKGYGETLCAIHSILAAPQAAQYALLVVNDQSPDDKLSAELDALAERGLFCYKKNPENLGFVRTINMALRLLPDKNVILFNTDAKVSGDWIDRMMRHAKTDPTIATITPFSNNATIFSYPDINTNNEIEMEISAAEIDRYAAACNKGRVTDMPTGVGFCLYVSAASRIAVGLLDEDAFGKGYGEENDFCFRAAKAGFRNVLAEDIFVYHVGQVSFGVPESVKTAPGQKALAEKHPEYPERIRQHLAADPSDVGRIRLDLKRIAGAAGEKPSVFIYHAMSGGIITHILQEEKRVEESGKSVIHIRVGAAGNYLIDLKLGGIQAPYCPNLRPVSFMQFASHLAEFLEWLDPEVIHIHSFVGFAWQATIAFMRLIQESNIPYRFTLHDYSIVCHRNDLVTPGISYCGLPGVEACRACVSADRSYQEAIDPSIRREAYSLFLEGAQQVYAPSQDLADRLKSAGAKYEIQVVPHKEEALSDIKPVAIGPERTVSVIVIGAIGPHKGSRVLLSLARDAQARNLPIRYHIVGYSDVRLELEAAGVNETGRYANEQEAVGHIKALQPTIALFPSIWPETYNYTLSLAFALHLLPVVFDIGAPADRIRESQFGKVLPYRLISEIKQLNDELLKIGLEVQSAAQPMRSQ